LCNKLALNINSGGTLQTCLFFVVLARVKKKEGKKEEKKQERETMKKLRKQ
jgi:hypothetical protein